MSNLIPLEKAAAILGMTVEQLTELRSNNEIFGYRDGSNWKFKMSELERVAGEQDIKLNISDADQIAEGSSDSMGLDLSDSSPDMILDDDSSGEMIEELDAEEYIEDSSVELLQSPSKESSNIELDDDSISLSSEDELIDLADSGLLQQDTSKLLDGDSGELKLDDSGDIHESEEDVSEGDDQLSFGSSSLKLASDSSKKLAGEGDASNLLDDEPEKDASSSDTDKLLGGGDDDDLLLSQDDLFGDELSLADDSSSFEDSAELSSDFEDSDLVLDDSDSSSEIVLEANTSGINLSANESGIAIDEEPLEMGGSDIDALEIPEDDDLIILENVADQDAATMMQEDDFNLTPLEASLEEDDSSGSQVIALEDSEIYADDSAATILGESEEFAAEPAMLEDAGFDSDMGYQDAGMAEAMMVPGSMAAGAAIPEAPYTLWQVISLGLVAFLLLMGSMVAYNLAQNMWMPQDQVIGSSVLNFFLRLTRMN